MTRSIRLALGIAATSLAAVACTANGVLANSPLMGHALQMVSAGHTGCAPAANQISQVHTQFNGSGTWRATCAGKPYQCSAFQGVNPSVSYSCAPAVDAPETANAASAEGSSMTQALQMVSAGHTGCAPAANQISQAHMQFNGSGTWSATCAGKPYRCSAFQGVSPSASYSCAPMVDAPASGQP